MTLGDLPSWIHAGIEILCVIASSWAFFRAKNRTELDEIWRASNSHGSRLTKLESAVEHLPTVDDVHSIEIKLTELNGRVQAIESHLDALSKDFQRLFQAILESKKP